MNSFGLPDLPGVPDLGGELPDLPDDWLDDEDRFVGLDPVTVPVGKRAVTYLRVSSAGQTRTSYDPLGQSIPTQRTACLGKSDSLGLGVVDEYVEPGKSALSIEKRPAFRRMLARIAAQRDVDYVIVYKFSRAARNQWEDAILGVALAKLGVKLISVTEPIDDTAAGKAMRGMIAVFNEFSSSASGEDIRYKMAEKAKRGGSLGLAPLGYLNFIDRTEGREIRTIVVDEERAPFIKLAFELYASGEYTLADLADELTDRGLRTRATAKRLAGPITASKLQRLLKNRYYLGIINFKGEEFPGRHTPLIDEELFDRVQAIIRSRGVAGERRRTHHHFLKGTVYCGECKRLRGIDQRLLVQHVIGRNGGEYFYFFCPNRTEGICHQPHHDVYRVEEAVEHYYRRKHFSDEFIELVCKAMDDAVSDQEQAQRLLKNQLDEQIDQLDTQEEHLIDLAADAQLPQAKIKSRLLRIQHDRDRLLAETQAVDTDLAVGHRIIEEHLALLRDATDLYLAASDENKRRLNQLLYQAIYIDEPDHTEVSAAALNDPYDALYAGQEAVDAAGWPNDRDAATAAYTRALAANHADKDERKARSDRPSTFGSWASLFTALMLGGVSSKPHMVELKGLEPSTPCMPCRCATSCATAPSPPRRAHAPRRALGESRREPSPGANPGRGSPRPRRRPRRGRRSSHARRPWGPG